MRVLVVASPWHCFRGMRIWPLPWWIYEVKSQDKLEWISNNLLNQFGDPVLQRSSFPQTVLALRVFSTFSAATWMLTNSSFQNPSSSGLDSEIWKLLLTQFSCSFIYIFSIEVSMAAAVSRLSNPPPFRNEAGSKFQKTPLSVGVYWLLLTLWKTYRKFYFTAGLETLKQRAESYL